MATAKDYNVEWRDKNGNLKGYLTPYVSNVNWEWNRLGGCGRCALTINKKYRELNFEPLDDIQIRVKKSDFMDSLTKLLIHFDGVDAATAYTAETGQVVTFAGTAQLDTAQKKFGTASLLLDGNSDYVTVPNSTDFDFGTGDFAIEFRARWNDRTGLQILVGRGIAGTDCWYIFKDATHHLGLYFIRDSAIKGHYTTNDVVISADNTWYSIVVERSGTGAYIFIDGVSKTLALGTAFGTNNVGSLSAVLNIGRGMDGGVYNYLNGWIDEVRISKGIARWTEDFTPQSYAYSHDTALTKLVYRGFIDNIVPALKAGQDIKLDVRGYFDLLKKRVIHTAGNIRVYTSNEVSVIVTNIIDTFVTPNTPITKGTIDAGSFTCDSIKFLSDVGAALRILAELTGDVEYGVDENLVFFWRTESDTIRHKFFIGNNVKTLGRRVDFGKLVNKLYLVAGDVAGVKYKRTAENTDSQSRYFLSEQIINNGSISTDTVADQYLGALLTESAQPVLNIRALVVNTDIRMEDTIPMGSIIFYDVAYDRNKYASEIGDIIGETADGGSNLTIGEIGDGGSDAIIGGVYRAQINRISYELSATPGRFNITIELGDTVLETSARIRKLEQAMNSEQQN